MQLAILDVKRLDVGDATGNKQISRAKCTKIVAVQLPIKQLGVMVASHTDLVSVREVRDLRFVIGSMGMIVQQQRSH